MFDDRSEAKSGKKAQGSDDDHDRDQPDDEERCMGHERARAGLDLLLGCQLSGNCQGRDCQPISGEQHDDTHGSVI